MLAILNSLNAHNFLISQQILMALVSKFMVYRALSYKANLSLGLLSPLIKYCGITFFERGVVAGLVACSLCMKAVPRLTLAPGLFFCGFFSLFS